MISHHRLEAESAEAYAAFCIYRDLGSHRSFAAAWQQHNFQRGKKQTECPGHWQRWSTLWSWVERAREYDNEIAAIEREAYAEKRRAMEQRRAAFEFLNQEALEANVLQADEMLRKASVAPLTDITQTREELLDGKAIKTINKVKALSLSGYAQLLRARNETGRQASMGIREQPAAVEDKQVVRVVLKTEKP